MKKPTCKHLSAILGFIVGTTLFAPWTLAGNLPKLEDLPSDVYLQAVTRWETVDSPDGNYVAYAAAADSVGGPRENMHYTVCKRNSATGCFSTHAQYKTPNDVKAGLFSPDSHQFAAAYHYGHKGQYTWIGIWSLPDGNLVNTMKRPGFIRDLTGVFDPNEFTSTSTTSRRSDARRTNEPRSTSNISKGGDARDYIRITRSRSRPDCDRAAGSTMYTYVFAENESSRPIAVKLTWSSGNPTRRFNDTVELLPNTCRQLGPEKDYPLGIKIEDAWYTGSRY